VTHEMFFFKKSKLCPGLKLPTIIRGGRAERSTWWSNWLVTWTLM